MMGLLVSYNLSLMIARKGKSHTIDEELILLSVKKVFDTILHHKMSSTFIKSIPLSNNTVKGRVDATATEI